MWPWVRDSFVVSAGSVIITPVLYISQSYNDTNEVIGMKIPRTGRAVCKGIMGNKDGKE